MMRFLVVLVLLLMGQGGRAWAADCPPGTYLRAIGSVATVGTTVFSTGGHNIRASRVACGTTACRATLYDADSGTNATNANVRDEPGAAANTSEWQEYDPPLSFVEGVTMNDDGNVAALLVYECR